MLTTASHPRVRFRSWLKFGYMKKKEAPGQNRTDASSLEGYSSTTELQARIKQYYAITRFF